MKKYLETLFSFSRKELNGILVLFAILLLLLLSHPLAGWLYGRPPAELSDPVTNQALLETLAMLEGGMPGRSRGVDRGQGRDATRERAISFQDRAPGEEASPGSSGGFPGNTAISFPFDPNTASEEDLLKLGLTPKVARTLLNYRNAGGRFYAREDLKKVYGLKAAEYERLEPFIVIGDRAGSGGAGHGLPDEEAASPPREKGALSRPRKERAAFTPDGAAFPAKRSSLPPEKAPLIDLNTADSVLLVKLPAIGPVLSARILRYRERLGGFHSVRQLREVYGLDTSAYKVVKPYFQEPPSPVRKIDINRADYSAFRRLPYWSVAQIRAVLNYRAQHGAFTDTDALYQIKALDSLTIQKVMPYLNVQLLTGYEYDRRENKINNP